MPDYEYLPDCAKPIVEHLDKRFVEERDRMYPQDDDDEDDDCWSVQSKQLKSNIQLKVVCDRHPSVVFFFFRDGALETWKVSVVHQASEMSTSCEREEWDEALEEALNTFVSDMVKKAETLYEDARFYIE